MPTAAQLSRLAALEAKVPASAAAGPMAGMTASEVREAVLSLLDQVGTSDSDPLLLWAQTAPDRDFDQFRDGQKPDNATWWIGP